MFLCLWITKPICGTSVSACQINSIEVASLYLPPRSLTELWSLLPRSWSSSWGLRSSLAAHGEAILAPTKHLDVALWWLSHLPNRLIVGDSSFVVSLCSRSRNYMEYSYCCCYSPTASSYANLESIQIKFWIIKETFGYIFGFTYL